MAASVRIAATRQRKMLYDARMAGSLKLRCGVVRTSQGRLWTEALNYLQLGEGILSGIIQ
ncbi:hypothetical protein [Roseovarius pacificus]|uniref:hypothetical protein n=1 Tax=Roseovarius pacificus TaxID=337701 RepID=UPI004039D1EB